MYSIGRLTGFVWRCAYSTTGASSPLTTCYFEPQPSQMLRGLVDYAGESEDENEEKSTSPNMDALALGPVKRKGDLLRRPDNLTKKFK
jgi:hypothetical protein